MGARTEIIDTFGSDTKEWGEAKVRYGKMKADLEKRIALSVGFE